MSAETINAVNTIFATGTLVFMAVSVFLLIGLISKDKGPIFNWFAKNTLFLVFLTALSGMIGSLVYEYVIGFAPCLLCWYQRIVMYPIAIIALVALVKKKSVEIFDYALVLSTIGLLISIWHNIEKFLGKDVLSCETAGGVSCLQIYVQKFGFIDIPVMSFVFFITLILLILNKRRLSTSPAE